MPAAEPRSMFPRDKILQWRLVIWATVVLVTVFGIGFGIDVRDCSRKGTADFEALQSGAEPVYAQRCCGMTDGGSAVYGDRGYRLVSVYRLIEVEGYGKQGHLIGAEITWRMPVRMFLRDAQSYWLVKPPSTNESKGKLGS